jgi:hypothetical protein
MGVVLPQVDPTQPCINMWHSPTNRHFTLKVHNIRHTMKFLVSYVLHSNKCYLKTSKEGHVLCVHYSIGLNVHLLQIQIHCHIILLYLTVLISIYCRYKSTVTKLITLQISHCTLPYNIVISHCAGLHILQIQIHCHKANRTTDITLHTVIQYVYTLRDTAWISRATRLYI